MTHLITFWVPITEQNLDAIHPGVSPPHMLEIYTFCKHASCRALPRVNQTTLMCACYEISGHVTTAFCDGNVISKHLSNVVDRDCFVSAILCRSQAPPLL